MRLFAAYIPVIDKQNLIEIKHKINFTALLVVRLQQTIVKWTTDSISMNRIRICNYTNLDIFHVN